MVASKFKTCARCNEAKSALVSRGGGPGNSLCGPCARSALLHRVKPGLDSARGAAVARKLSVETEDPAGVCVAVALSGKMSSRVLLHAARVMLRPQVAQASTSKSGQSRPYDVSRLLVLHVRDVRDFATPADLHEHDEALCSMVEQEGGEAAGLELVLLSLDDVFEDSEAVECTAEHSSGPRFLARATAPHEAPLQALLSRLAPLTTPRAQAASARTRAQELRAIFIKRLLDAEARKRGAAALLLGESATRMAAKTVGSLVGGAGYKAPVELGTASWVKGLLVVRPLRDVMQKEVAFFAHTKPLDYLSPRGHPSDIPVESSGRDDASDKATIGTLTEALVYLLERGTPSTVSTVNKTTSKLVFRREEDAASRRGGSSSASASAVVTAERARIGTAALKLLQSSQALPRYDGKTACPLCGLPASKRVKAWRERLTISKLAPEGEAASAAEASVAREHRIDLGELLCYACSLILDTPDLPPPRGAAAPAAAEKPTMPLPPYVLRAALARLAEEQEGTTEAGALGTGVAQTQEDDAAATDAVETAEGAQNHPAKGSHVPRIVERDEMRAKFEEFLLDGGEEEG